jgi:hypothetical protein
MMTVVTVRIAVSPDSQPDNAWRYPPWRSLHLHGDVCRVGDNVVDRRSLLRLGDQSFNIFPLGIGVDFVSSKPLRTNVAVDAENSLQIHVALDRRFDRAQLNLPVLSDGRDAGGEAARQPDQDVLDGRRPLVCGGENFRVVGIEGERGLAPLLLPEAIKTLDRGVTMRSVFPFTGRAPFELGSHGSLRERFARRDQCFDVHAIIHRTSGIGHDRFPLFWLPRNKLERSQGGTLQQIQQLIDLRNKTTVPLYFQSGNRNSFVSLR